MRRTGRLLSPVLIVGTLFAVTATAAQAATVISAPTITAPLGGLGPYPVGTPVTAYRISHLSATSTATVQVGQAQKLP